MKTFKQFLEEAQNNRPPKKKETWEEREFRLAKEAKQAKLSNQKPATMNDWDVIPDDHSKSAAYERHPEKSTKAWEKLYHRITKHLEHQQQTKGMDSHTGVYFSRGLNHGIVANVDAHNKRVHIVTTLPQGKHTASHNDDVHVMVESVKFPVVYFAPIFVD